MKSCHKMMPPLPTWHKIHHAIFPKEERQARFGSEARDSVMKGDSIFFFSNRAAAFLKDYCQVGSSSVDYWISTLCH